MAPTTVVPTTTAASTRGGARVAWPQAVKDALTQAYDEQGFQDIKKVPASQTPAFEALLVVAGGKNEREVRKFFNTLRSNRKSQRRKMLGRVLWWPPSVGFVVRARTPWTQHTAWPLDSGALLPPRSGQKRKTLDAGTPVDRHPGTDRWQSVELNSADVITRIRTGDAANGFRAGLTPSSHPEKVQLALLAGLEVADGGGATVLRAFVHALDTKLLEIANTAERKAYKRGRCSFLGKVQALTMAWEASAAFSTLRAEFLVACQLLPTPCPSLLLLSIF